jgi:hypothetical protein
MTNTRTSRTRARAGLLAAAILLSGAGTGLATATPAAAKVSDGYVSGAYMYQDDFGDEGTLSTSSHAHTNATALWQWILLRLHRLRQLRVPDEAALCGRREQLLPVPQLDRRLSAGHPERRLEAGVLLVRKLLTPAGAHCTPISNGSLSTVNERDARAR